MPKDVKNIFASTKPTLKIRFRGNTDTIRPQNPNLVDRVLKCEWLFLKIPLYELTGSIDLVHSLDACNRSKSKQYGTDTIKKFICLRGKTRSGAREKCWPNLPQLPLECRDGVRPNCNCGEACGSTSMPHERQNSAHAVGT